MSTRNVCDSCGAMHKFELVNTFQIVVPEDYNHGKQLDSFRKKIQKSSYYYSGGITDNNYAKATTRLKPGQKLKVKVFQIEGTVNSEDCMDKLRFEKAILVGAHGASLVWEQKKEELPVNRWSASFDEKDALWKDVYGDYMVPGVNRDSDVDFGFITGSFMKNLNDGSCLLCFSEPD